jgi:hypothetical protein
MKDPQTISFKEFNELMDELGWRPYPLGEITIDKIDEEHFKLSVRAMIDRLAKWATEQQNKYNTSGED